MKLDDVLFNTPTGVTTSVGASVASLAGMELPFLINVATFVYLVLLILHKGWKIYKEWKYGSSSE